MIIYHISSGKIWGQASPEADAAMAVENLGNEYAMVSEDGYTGQPYYRDGDFVDYTEEETNSLISENNLITFRAERNRLLNNSDWTQVPDSPLSDSKKTEWQTYRQALRDMPSQEGFDPLNPTYPTEPTQDFIY